MIICMCPYFIHFLRFLNSSWLTSIHFLQIMKRRERERERERERINEPVSERERERERERDNE